MPVDPAGDAGYVEHPPRIGFFTDTSICIGCKACEVACKEWNEIPSEPTGLTGFSLDNTATLGADSWRHVAFIEQGKPLGVAEPQPGEPEGAMRWLMASDVCKHCTHAACLDVCPTGSLFRTEFGSVVVQEDICNGCGYCIPACPFGVIDRREDDGRAFKCTLCYGERPDDGIGGAAAFFLLLDEPEVYGLPPDPIVTTRDLPRMWRSVGLAAGALAAAVGVSCAGRGR